MSVKPDLKPVLIIAAVAVVFGLPVLFYAMGDFPRRSLFKETLSVLTILAFMAVLGQFFLARSNTALLSLFKPLQIQRVHKRVAYGAVCVLLAHPFLIVLPRVFEGGIRPWDALITMLTSFQSLGVILGLIGWVALLVLSLTAVFRMALIRRLGLRYRNWRYVHGGLALGFVTAALWHAIDLGRHTGWPLSLLMVALAVLGGMLLLRLYRSANAPSPSSSFASAAGATPIAGGANP